MPFGTAQLDLKQLIGSLRTAGGSRGEGSQANLSIWPFVTISRQAGAGGRTCGKLLAELLDLREPDGHRWQCLDRELVERIAADHHLSADLINSLETSSHSWISDFLSGLSHEDKQVSELVVFRRVVETIRALARAGNVILVGLGGAYIARDMPGGLHLRIVAPFEWRVQNLARQENLTPAKARQRVQTLDQDREAFFQKFFPGKSMSHDDFHLTLNASMLTDEQMARCAAVLIPKSEGSLFGRRQIS